MVEDTRLQEKILTYRIIEARIESLLKQREALGLKLMEIDTTLNGIDEIEKTEGETLFSLGSETYFFGKVLDKKRMIVEIGADIVLEKTFEEGRQILKERKGEIENLIANLESNVVQLSSGLQEMESQINEMVGRGKEVS